MQACILPGVTPFNMTWTWPQFSSTDVNTAYMHARRANTQLTHTFKTGNVFFINFEVLWPWKSVKVQPVNFNRGFHCARFQSSQLNIPKNKTKPKILIFSFFFFLSISLQYVMDPTKPTPCLKCQRLRTIRTFHTKFKACLKYLLQDTGR